MVWGGWKISKIDIGVCLWREQAKGSEKPWGSCWKRKESDEGKNFGQVQIFLTVWDIIPEGGGQATCQEQKLRR